MEAVFGALLDWIDQHPLWAGFTVFAVSLAESLAIVGMVVPGVVILFGVGALISTGALGFWEMSAWAVVGAIIGDGLSYWLGHHYKDSLPHTWPFNRFPKALAQGEHFFNRYGALSVAFARFFGPGRATVPLVAGMLAMRPGPFLAANVGSALLWGPAFLLPGVLFGASMEIASEVALGLVVLLATLVILVWATGWLAHRIFRWIQPHAGEMLLRLLVLGQRLPWLRRIAEAIGNPQHPEARGLAVYAGLLTLSMGALIVVSPLLSVMPTWRVGDTLLARTLASLRNAFGDQLLLPLAHWGDPLFVLFAGLLVGTVLALARRWVALGNWLISAIFALAIVALLHLLSPALKPGGLTPDPSVLASGILIGFAVVIAVRPVPLKLRWLIYSSGTIVVALGGFARLYFGLANLGGMLTAVLLALAWVAGIGVAYRTHALAESVSGRVAVFSLAGLLFGHVLATQQEIYAPPKSETPEPILLTETAWRERGWSTLPRLRIDLRHESGQPLNLQYAGRLTRLEQLLGSAGWTPSEPLSVENLTRLLSPSTPLAQLPLLPHVHRNAHETAAWVKLIGDKRLVIRFWPSGRQIDTEGPLWLGSVSAQRKRTRFDLLTFAETTHNSDQALRALRSDLHDKVTDVAPPTTDTPWLFKPSHTESIHAPAS